MKKKPVIHEIELPVRGMNHRITLSTRRVLANIARKEHGIACELLREPDNFHDPNAVKVIMMHPPMRGVHVGYIAKGVAAALAPLMDSEDYETVLCSMTTIDAETGEATLYVQFTASRKLKGATVAK